MSHVASILDTSSPPVNPLGKPPPSKSSVIAAIAGNTLEFYDFTIYALFAVTIGQTFFPSTDPFVSLILSVAVFGVGFVTRPIGSVVIGAYADRAGRKPALMLTVALMAIGVATLAITPSYERIGIAAPILVVLARLVQGFALGGEVGPATAYLVEAAPPGRRGLYGSWQTASQGLAHVIAAAIGLALSLILARQNMDGWGWRIPFLLGLLIVPAAIFMRRNMPETLENGEPSEQPGFGSILANLFRNHTRQFVLATMVVTSGTIGAYVSLYMTTYARTTLHQSESVAMAATLVGGTCSMASCLIGGWLSDTVGRKWVMIPSHIAYLLALYPGYYLINAFHNATSLLLVVAFLATIGGLGGGCALVIISESFPASVRSTGMAMAYALAVTVFGGTTQMVVTWLIHVTGNPMTPALYSIAAGGVGLVAKVLMVETNNKPLKP
ncbi:MFS transporter [Bradyrhizobium sp. LTSPM299]|uniref:MFS transporter n=1 Tax=Bradyrhizobium sp. LTSPM299 TaxID=1619233 RepID=UPI00067854F3|nr:MFS transporter [Bradyrhizobium sp. LTSPM299]